METKRKKLIRESKGERKKGRSEIERESKCLSPDRIQRPTYLKFSPATISSSTPEVTHTIFIHYHSSRLLHSELGVGLRKLRPPSVIDDKDFVLTIAKINNCMKSGELLIRMWGVTSDFMIIGCRF